jgi:bis(5'-nucleosidyl)-tetraphosphatase
MADVNQVIRQAGAIAVRSGSSPMILLVKAKKNPDHWIFPKGHIEPGETAEVTAGRELAEEAGIKGNPVQRAGESVFCIGETQYHVVYYLMSYHSTLSNGEPGRSPRWCTVEEANRLLSFSDIKRILIDIASLVNKIGRGENET